MSRLHIRVSPEFLERLEAYCRHHGVDKTAVVKIAIVEYLDRREKQHTENLRHDDSLRNSD